jgi:hypothetical protein
MRTYDEALAAAVDDPAFSNGTEGEAWMANNCERCTHDKGTRDGTDESGCPLVMVAILGQTPSEWIETERFGLGDSYTCVEFRGEDEPDYEPKPLPVDPDQLELIPADPYRGVRMFVQPEFAMAVLTPDDPSLPWEQS